MASILQTSQSLALGLDIALWLVLFAVKVGLLVLIVRFVCHIQRGLRLKSFVFVVAVLSLVYFLTNTTPQSLISLRAFALVSLCGALLCMRSLWLEFKEALICCLIFCGVSILLVSGVHRGLEGLAPDRITVAQRVRTAIDARTRTTAGNTALPPSSGVMPALLRYVTTPSSDGFVDALLSPMRAAQQAKAQIGKINKVKEDEAALVNMLSGAGTNVRSHAEEMAAMRQELVAEAAGGVAQPTTGVKPVRPATVQPSVAGSPAEDAATLMAAAAPENPSAAMTREVAAVQPEAKPQIPAPGTAYAPADPRPSSTQGKQVMTAVLSEITGTDSLSLKDRSRWVAALKLIPVSGVVHSPSRSYAVVQGRNLREGATCTVVYNGTEYTFLLRQVSLQGVCKWEPVLPVDESVDVISL